jgi:subtilisin-like proprotein convertase family protein
MMKTLIFFSILLSAFFHAQSYSNNTVYIIPENNTGGIRSDIFVPLNTTILDPTKVTIEVDVSHSWGGDLTLALVLPGRNGFGAISLIRRIGTTISSGSGTSAKFVAGNILSFNAAATNQIVPPPVPNSTIPTGLYRPTAGFSQIPQGYSVANLTTLLTNVQVNGTWSLKGLDSTSGDTGSINNWRIIFDSGALGVNYSVISTPGLTVMGNPFKETLNLKVNTVAKEVKFDIYSVDGKKVYSHQNSMSKNTSGDLKIATENWATGIYILTPIINGKQMMSIKLLKK